MQLDNELKHPFRTFVILTNVIFILFLAFIGFLMSINQHKVITDILIIVSAWSSTFALIILFKRIYTDINFLDFIKNNFRAKLDIIILLIIIIVQLLIFLIGGASFTHNIGISAIIISFFSNLIRGPLGEELGWRGFALIELQKRYSNTISSLIIGCFWGLWHAPLWLITSGFTGSDLLIYCLSFMLGIISISIIAGYFYNLTKNLIYPIIIHQLFNFLFSLNSGDILKNLLSTALLYSLFALIILVINIKFTKTRQK